MDIHAFQGDKAVHILTTHRVDADTTPLQMVSAAKVAHWQKVEVDLEALMARLNEDDLGELHPEITPVKKAGE